MKKMDLSAAEVLSDCVLCPRNCHVDRVRGQRGFCGEAGEIRAARAALYYTEEPVISGKRGSGTVFFAGCSLGCIYCQNRQISRPGTLSSPFSKEPFEKEPLEKGSLRKDLLKKDLFEKEAPPEDRSGEKTSLPRILEISPGRMAEIFLNLQEQGAHNINLVTPEHFVPLLIPDPCSQTRQREGALDPHCLQHRQLRTCRSCKSPGGTGRCLAAGSEICLFSPLGQTHRCSRLFSVCLRCYCRDGAPVPRTGLFRRKPHPRLSGRRG